MNISTTVLRNTGELVKIPMWQTGYEALESNEDKVWVDSLEPYGGPEGAQVYLISGNVHLSDAVANRKQRALELAGLMEFALTRHKRTRW